MNIQNAADIAELAADGCRWVTTIADGDDRGTVVSRHYRVEDASRFARERGLDFVEVADAALDADAEWYVATDGMTILSLALTAEDAWAACIRDVAPVRVTGDGASAEALPTVDDDPSDYDIRIMPATPALAAAYMRSGERVEWHVGYYSGVADVDDAAGDVADDDDDDDD